MKCMSTFLLFSLLMLLPKTIAVGIAAKSLRVEMVPGTATRGCCSVAYYLETSKELFKYVNETTIQSLQAQNISTDNLIINNFYLINTNQCLFRERNLRGDDNEQPARRTATNQYSTSCKACSKASCSSYCSGCYLCASNRRDLSLLSGILGLVGGVVNGVLGVTLGVLGSVVGVLDAGIQDHFATWLSTGPGASLAKGCMGDPSQIQVTITLV